MIRELKIENKCQNVTSELGLREIKVGKILWTRKITRGHREEVELRMTLQVWLRII